ncbi:MAG: hypothetical protein QOF62_1930 [Pyrinomonadaceae bacterium]|jgi:hypothetical protein|nr:hypothetical protein [Pyrinomonadaceae bacterium]
MPNEPWPELKFAEWQDTLATLHMWTQVVGKIRLKQTPLVNHWWNVPLYVSARGLTTTAMPYGDRYFEIEFDFIDHKLRIECSDGALKLLDLRPQSVADFYAEVMAALRELKIEVKIWTMPVEVPDPIRFEDDTTHTSYDAEYANRFWHALLKMDPVFQEFRARFIGKVSPVHFFWGSFDIAVTRFSGRPAPPREDADVINREAYSHEVISHGFWPGNKDMEAAFYSYTAPEPAGLSDTMSQGKIRPAETFYSLELKEFFLPYDSVRRAALDGASVSPETALMDFCQTTYEAGADLAQWDRAALER